MRGAITLVALALAAVLFGATDGSASSAQATKLFGTVGPEFGPAPITAKTRVVLTSGPSQRITLRTAAGRAVTRMKVGTYRVTVRDRSSFHNANVRAPGFSRKTTVGFVGTQRWRIRLARAGTLRFLCDPHAAVGMRGSARIVR
jgi:hypothetical protein